MVTTSITELDSDIIRKDRGTNLIFADKSGEAASTQGVLTDRGPRSSHCLLNLRLLFD